LLSPRNERQPVSLQTILLSQSALQKQLEELERYVKIDEHLSAVHTRLAPHPLEQISIDRSTEPAYDFGDSNLVLAIRGNGTIAGIRRHIHGSDDGTVWLSPPSW
jgi:hypothetical protein